MIPAEVIRPGLEMVIEIDSDMLDPELRVARRIPETGSLAVNVHEMPVLDLTLIPFLWRADPDSAILELTAGMAADPNGHELLAATRTLLPVGELDVTAHQPVFTSSNDMYDVFRETEATRAQEAASGNSPAAVAESAPALMLWGGADSTGLPFLEPAFAVDAPPLLPDIAGNHRITGTTAGGETLFSISFAMPDLGDSSGASSFAFVLPARPVWQKTLTAITLTGAGGRAVLNSESSRSMAIMLDPRTGHVRGFLRDPTPPAADAVGGVAGQRLDRLYSSGIPDAAAWTRVRR